MLQSTESHDQDNVEKKMVHICMHFSTLQKYLISNISWKCSKSLSKMQMNISEWKDLHLCIKLFEQFKSYEALYFFFGRKWSQTSKRLQTSLYVEILMSKLSSKEDWSTKECIEKITIKMWNSKKVISKKYINMNIYWTGYMSNRDKWL